LNVGKKLLGKSITVFAKEYKKHVSLEHLR